MKKLFSTIIGKALGLFGIGKGRATLEAVVCNRRAIEVSHEDIGSETIELCDPQMKAILEDGSILEECKGCNMSLLWVVKNNRPYRVFEQEGEFGDFVEVYPKRELKKD